MQGKILIVDPIATNRIVLKVKLKKAYYEVMQAETLRDACQIARKETPDLVITALDLPDGSAADLGRRLTVHPKTKHIPVLATCCSASPSVRLETLETGVRDILCQPVDETLLLGRVRSLIRAHNAAAEWHMREDTCSALGFAEAGDALENQGHCVMVSNDKAHLHHCAHALRTSLGLKLTLTDALGVMATTAAEQVPDVFILLLPEDRSAALEELRVISTLRASAQARHVGIIAVQSAVDPTLGANALDLGADDLMPDGFHADELALRGRAVMRRKRMADKVRATVRTGLKAAVFDPLTGLYNRRYAMPHLTRTTAHAQQDGRQFAVLVADLDHFKRINDVYGHAAGDVVLAEVADRLRKSARRADMVARIGGEEFLIIMPATSLTEARAAGIRICENISQTPFAVPNSPSPIDVTISIGMAVGGATIAAKDQPEKLGLSLLGEADAALFAAKGRGRNQVTSGRPAA